MTSASGKSSESEFKTRQQGIPVEKTSASLLNDIRERVGMLETSLPRRVDAMALSTISKLPYKALLYREALIWRMAELGREALESFEKDKLVSAIVLTRAAVAPLALRQGLALKGAVAFCAPADNARRYQFFVCSSMNCLAFAQSICSPSILQAPLQTIAAPLSQPFGSSSFRHND
jgi:hypothetical protein